MTEDERNAKAPFDRELQAHLGQQLRRLFNETAAQPIPDRFAALLERLDRAAPAPPLPAESLTRPQEAF
jgi:hypothetical protein